MTSIPEIALPSHLRERLAQGHPWVYRNHVPPQVRLRSGTWVRASCGGWAGYALWDAEGPIALRIYSTRHVPDARWLRDRVEDAWELREPLRAAGVTAYRLLFGEGDGLPGLTVDLYGDYAVVQTYMEGASALLGWLVNALLATASPRGILLRGAPDEGRPAADEGPRTKDEGGPDEGPRTEDEGVSVPAPAPQRPSAPAPQRSGVRVLWGEAPPRDLTVVEHGLRFLADLRAGQKTGLFLDHRENRRYIEGLSAGRSVLNCFAYTGAFSLYALRGGAASVVSADIGKGLAAAAEANIALNGLDAARHRFATEDCFELLQRYADQGRSFDLLILDPPSFAKSRQSRHAALRAYTRLNALALRCVAPGGFLATASCTSQVGPEAFRELLAAACASAERRLQIIHEAGQPLDHPVPAHFPEGRYLKFVAGRVGI
jgi:23S rRNA (cytosine1962-C5)-methyltransferase